MNPIEVRTVEELKLIQKHRSSPTVIIQGALANDLLISGMVRRKSDCRGDVGELEVTEQRVNSGLYPIYRILCDLSTTNHFTVMDEENLSKIRIYPKPSLRREGN